MFIIVKMTAEISKGGSFWTGGGTVSLFIMSLGWNCIEHVENFFISNVVHLSTLITISAHWHHLVNQFRINWFSHSELEITAASSANWNQWTGLNRWFVPSWSEKPSCSNFSAFMDWINVLKHILKSSGLKQSPCKTPRWTGMAGVLNWFVMIDVLKSV